MYKLQAIFKELKLLFNFQDILHFVKKKRYKRMNRKFFGVNFLGNLKNYKNLSPDPFLSNLLKNFWKCFLYYKKKTLFMNSNKINKIKVFLFKNM